MKMNIRLVLAVAMVLSISLISCKKDRNNDNTDLATHSDDESRVASGTDDVANDANDVAGGFEIGRAHV